MVQDWLDTFVGDVLDTRTTRVSAPALTEFTEFDPGRDAHAVLGHVLLGYSPIIDARAGVFGTRLTVVPARAASSAHAGALLEAVSEVWAHEGIVSLNIGLETLLQGLLQSRPSANIVIEVPAFMAANPANTQALLRLAARGNLLLLKGRPLAPLPPEILPCFKWSIVDLSEERRTPEAGLREGVKRTIPHIQSGVRTMAEMRRSFALGAVAVIGWPLHDVDGDTLETLPDARIVLEALRSIDRGDSPDATHHTLMCDPVLAYELMHQLSAGDPLAVETASMRHAVSLIGTPELRRWLGDALGRSNRTGGLRPANFAALRRGLLMRMLAPSTGLHDARGELFMCGVLSLLDRIYDRPVSELARRLTLPEAVRAALVDHSGPYAPLLALARAIESSVPHDIRAAADDLYVAPIEINLALLRALLVAARLEQSFQYPGISRHSTWHERTEDPVDRR